MGKVDLEQWLMQTRARARVWMEHSKGPPRARHCKSQNEPGAVPARLSRSDLWIDNQAASHSDAPLSHGVAKKPKGNPFFVGTP